MGDLVRKHRWPVSKIKKWVNTFQDHEITNQLIQKNRSNKQVFYSAHKHLEALPITQ